MNIGVIGSGQVGGTLGKRWAQGGHRVTFSSRKPDSSEMRELLREAGSNASAATVQDCARQNDVLLLATPWPGTQDALKHAGDVSGKVLIDATNPLLPNLEGLEHGTTTSGAEQVAYWAQGAKVVKAFNTVGFNVMANPEFDASNAVLFYCGDDPEAKQAVYDLAKELGFDARDAGPLKQARLLEPFAMLWISLAIQQGYGRDFAFRLIGR
jgi:8-hydroxy-5-deazaflavin:NADPH oxidoreductase